jgi:hypothetical protein
LAGLNPRRTNLGHRFSLASKATARSKAALARAFSSPASTALSLLFKKTAPALVNDAPDALGDGRQNPGEFKLNPDLSVFDIDEAKRYLSRHTHSKIEPVAGPHPAVNRYQPSERRDHLIDARFQTTPRLCPA